jgi:hypothetical protein
MEFVRDEKKVDPFGQWVTMRRDRLHAFRPLHVVLLIALGFVVVKVVRRVKSLWIALALSLAVVISVVETTCYYYSMFILAALLSRHRRGVEAWVLCVAGVSQLLALNRFLSSFYDDLYTTQSVLFCGFALSLLFAYWPPRRKSTSGPSGQTRPSVVGPLPDEGRLYGYAGDHAELRLRLVPSRHGAGFIE